MACPSSNVSQYSFKPASMVGCDHHDSDAFLRRSASSWPLRLCIQQIHTISTASFLPPFFFPCHVTFPNMCHLCLVCSMFVKTCPGLSFLWVFKDPICNGLSSSPNVNENPAQPIATTSFFFRLFFSFPAASFVCCSLRPDLL